MCLKTGTFLESATILIAFQSIELFTLDEIFPMINRAFIDMNLLIRYITKKTYEKIFTFWTTFTGKKMFHLGQVGINNMHSALGKNAAVKLRYLYYSSFNPLL